MRKFATSGVVAVGLVLAGAALAAKEDDHTQGVREELDADLKKLVDIPPPRVEIVFKALDEPNIKLVDAQFTLDGIEVSAPGLEVLGTPGDHALFAGQVGHGQHSLVSSLTYEDMSSGVLNETGGYKWKVGNTFTFPAQRGLEVKVITTPELVASAKEIKDRLKVSSTATPKIVARIEDGIMPPPPVARVFKTPEQLAQEEADAKAAEAKLVADGEEAARKTKAEQAVLSKQQAAEAAKLARATKLEEARLAKKQAAEARKLAREQALLDKKAKLEEARAARAQALADRKAAAEEARVARAQALADRKAAAAEARAARAQGATAPEPRVAANSDEAKAARAQALAEKQAAAEEAKAARKAKLDEARAAKAQALAERKAAAEEAKAAKAQAIADKKAAAEEAKAAKAQALADQKAGAGQVKVAVADVPAGKQDGRSGATPAGSDQPRADAVPAAGSSDKPKAEVVAAAGSGERPKDVVPAGTGEQPKDVVPAAGTAEQPKADVPPTGASGSTGAEPAKLAVKPASDKAGGSAGVTAPLEEGGGVPLLYLVVGVVAVFGLALVGFLVLRRKR